MSTDAREAMARLRAAYEAFAAADLEAMTRPELLALIDDYETLSAQLPAQSHRLLARLQTETTPKALGAKSWNEVLRLRYFDFLRERLT